MDSLDEIVSENGLRKFPHRIIANILVIHQIYGISYRSSGKFFNNHPELMNLAGMNSIPIFRTVSYGGLRVDWDEINACIIHLVESNCDNAAIESFIVKTCIDSTVQRRSRSIK